MKMYLLILSHIKKMKKHTNINTTEVFDNTVNVAKYTGALTGTVGGIRATYDFSPDKSHCITYNAMHLLYNVSIHSYWYGIMGFCNAITWPISIPCWIISTIKYVKKPHCAD
jgi:hypothetical protein